MPPLPRVFTAELEGIVMSTRRLLLGPTLALVSAAVYGADETTISVQQEEKPTELEAVTVTASPLGQEELHIAQPVTVLGPIAALLQRSAT